MPADAARDTDTRQGKWLLCAGVAVCALILTLWPQGLATFGYDRVALASGEAWRVVSAHLVHLNGVHLLLNLLGLFLICELLWGDLPPAQGGALLLFSAVGVSASLWWFQPQLLWYAGLSGALHGLWAGCALAACWPPAPQRRPARLVGAVGFALLLAKLALEWHFGSSAQTARMIGAPVVTPAHLYGALAGSAYLLAWRVAGGWRRRW